MSRLKRKKTKMGGMTMKMELKRKKMKIELKMNGQEDLREKRDRTDWKDWVEVMSTHSGRY